MDFFALLRSAWRITWTTRALWVLNLLLIVTAFPALSLSEAFGAVPTLQSLNIPGLPTQAFIGRVPLWGWIVVALVAFITLVITAALTWLLFTATAHGADLAATQGAVSLRQALQIGPQRIRSILTLSLIFSTLVAALGVGPTLGLILAQAQASPLASTFLLIRATLAPVSTLLNLALFLISMSIAVEGHAPRQAAGRSWRAFKAGWFGFIGVAVLTGLLVLGVCAPALTLVIIIPLAMVFEEWRWLLLCGGGGCVGALELFLMLFTAVFTTTLYTLIYRAAAYPAEPAAPPA